MLALSASADLEENIQRYSQRGLTGLVKVSAQKQQWLLYCLLGQIVWTRSNIHPVRRWRRHLLARSPRFFEQATLFGTLPYESWNYTALARLVHQKKFSRERFSKIAEGCIAEDFFDILRVSAAQKETSNQALRYEVQEKSLVSVPFVVSHREYAWQRAQREWRAWEQAKLTRLSPNLAPVIVAPDRLRSHTSAPMFEQLTAFAEGENTLRDLAIHLNQPLVSVAHLMLSGLSQKSVRLIAIADLSPGDRESSSAVFPSEKHKEEAAEKKEPATTARPPAFVPTAITQNQQPSRIAKNAVAAKRNEVAKSSESTPNLSGNVASEKTSQIVYIDDSSTDSYLMGEVIRKLGYQYNNIADPLSALPILLELKPDLIFLDLVMPTANGYEVCAQIRRISRLKSVPIIIVTSNDGITDRVRARIVGASGFIGKPIRHSKVEKTVKKHLYRMQSKSLLSG